MKCRCVCFLTQGIKCHHLFVDTMYLNSYYDDIEVKMGAAKAKWIDYSQKWMLYISILLSSFISHSALAPWFFARDHTHYSRWVPVHIRDMTTLHERLPGVAKEFDRGSFVVHKSTRPFSVLSHSYRPRA